MRNLFRPRPGHEAAVFAEAQSMLDDGVAFDEVLRIFSNDAPWLKPLLETTDGLDAALEAEPASYYFHASLKSRFLEAANERRYRPAARRQSAVASKTRTLAASATVLASTAAAGVVTLGFVTADGAVPGDWNYSFKLAHERVEYALATGDDKTNLQIHQAQARVYEIQVLTSRGNVSEDQIRKLQDEAAQLRAQYEKQGPTLDEVQRTQLRALQDLSTVVLNQAQEKNDRVKPAASAALNAVTEAVAAGAGTTVSIPEPTATREAAPASTTPVTGTTDPTGTTGSIPEVTNTPPPVTTPPPTAVATPVPPTPTPTEPPPTPTATATPETPVPTETATPTVSVSPTATRTPTP